MQAKLQSKLKIFNFLDNFFIMSKSMSFISKTGFNFLIKIVLNYSINFVQIIKKMMKYFNSLFLKIPVFIYSGTKRRLIFSKHFFKHFSFFLFPFENFDN